MHLSDIFIHQSSLVLIIHMVIMLWNPWVHLFSYLWTLLLCFIFQSATHSPTDGHSSVTSAPSSVPIGPWLQPHWVWSRGPHWTSKGQHQSRLLFSPSLPLCSSQHFVFPCLHNIALVLHFLCLTLNLNKILLSSLMFLSKNLHTESFCFVTVWNRYNFWTSRFVYCTPTFVFTTVDSE